MQLKALRHEIDWRATVEAGIIGGVVFLVLGGTLLPIFGLGSAWTLPRMIAQMVLGQSLVSPTSIDLVDVVVATSLHFGLSIGYAVLLVSLAHRFAPAPALLVGALFGLALYVVNFHGFAILFPWFEAARGVALVAIHVAYGLAAAGAYELLERSHDRRSDALLFR